MSANIVEAGVTHLTASVPVTEVTLLEDRAMVVRRGTIELPPGRSRLRIGNVAPVLVDKTLSAALALPAGTSGDLHEDLRVRSVTVVRRKLVKEAEQRADIAEVRAQRRTKQQEQTRLQQRSERLGNERSSLDKLLALTLAELNEDVGWGRQEQVRWAEQIDLLEAKLRELGVEQRRLNMQHAILVRELEDLGKLEAATSSPETEAVAELTLEFLNPEQLPRKLELRIDYLVPGALWRPWHTARLIEGDKPTVEFRTEGAVWQATGEDWTDVQLIFSTERPSLGVTPPSLASDVLRFRKKSSTVEVEQRDEKIHTAGLGADEAQKKEANELPGIDDGGEPMELRGRSKASVPSDGRPYRVPIFSFTAPAEVALTCAPELADAVMLRSRQANLADRPLLAGPVDLVRNSGLVGRTSLMFIAPGERFELGWGPDSSLRVFRKVEELEHERRALSSWTRKPRRVSIRLSNLAPARKTIEVKERIAVSEIEKVEVEVTEASHEQKPNADGIVTWSVELPGFGHETLWLAWVLVVHDDVVGL
jgi:uncharacterized protein (TIGR02231 family)